MDAKEEKRDPYHPLMRAVELLNKGKFNGLFCLGKAGTGKSFRIDQKLNEIKADFKLFKGEISEAKFWEFIQVNNGKILVFRDTARLLRRLSFIDTLKSMTEDVPQRVISRATYAKHNKDIKEEFEFKGKIIFEINDIMKKYKEDLTSLFTRGLFVELVLSREDIERIMFKICNTEEKKTITKYLIEKYKGYNLNLRHQAMGFKVYEASQAEGLDWKKQIDLYLETQISEICKALYRATGFKPLKRMEFVKYLIATQEVSYATAQRRIAEGLILEEIFDNGLLKQSLLSLRPIQKVK